MNFSIAQGNTLPVKLEQMLDYLTEQMYVQMFVQKYTLSPPFCANLKTERAYLLNVPQLNNPISNQTNDSATASIAAAAAAAATNA
jgi:hypothetical protein